MELDEAIVPIFIETEIPKKTTQIGSAIFINFESDSFLVTAAHVTDNEKYGALLVPTSGGLSEIEGYFAHIALAPEAARKDDTVDIAYFRLTKSFATDLKHYFSEIPQHKLELPNNENKSLVASIVGYPITKSQKKKNVFTSELMYYRGVTASIKTYEKLGLSPKTHTIVQFRKKHCVSTLYGPNYNPPSPKGASGGAIFIWPEGQELSTDWNIPYLAGVFHTYKEKDNLMIGTNILPFLSAVMLRRMKNSS